MIAHLNGREKALEAFGWTGRKAQWIALVCLHSGVFTRAQLSAYLGVHLRSSRRFVQAMTAAKLVVEHTADGRKVCRIFSRRIYRALGVEDVRHRKTAIEEVVTRRLLSLDYVIEHTGVPWLPTEQEKVAAFEALGIERELLPSRLYRGAAGDTRRYFPVKLPVALDADRVVFVHTDPGHRTASAFRSWGSAHERLWRALRERGLSVEVVAVVRTRAEFDRSARVLGRWARAMPASRSAAAPPDRRWARREIARIERAIRSGDEAAVAAEGGLQGCLRRIVELKCWLRIPHDGPVIDDGVTWRSKRFHRGRP